METAPEAVRMEISFPGVRCVFAAPMKAESSDRAPAMLSLKTMECPSAAPSRRRLRATSQWEPMRQSAPVTTSSRSRLPARTRLLAPRTRRQLSWTIAPASMTLPGPMEITSPRTIAAGSIVPSSRRGARSTNCWKRG